jgi:hypothetical protein
VYSHGEHNCADSKHRCSEEVSNASKGLQHETLTKALQTLSKENTWRVKGFLRLIDKNSVEASVYILNWAFGRYELRAVQTQAANNYLKDEETIRLTIMGERGEVKRVARRLADSLGANVL